MAWWESLEASAMALKDSASQSFRRMKYDDIFLFLVSVTLILRAALRLFSSSKDSGQEFFFNVPQASEEQKAIRKKKAETRNIARAFREYVSLDHSDNLRRRQRY